MRFNIQFSLESGQNQDIKKNEMKLKKIIILIINRIERVDFYGFFMNLSSSSCNRCSYKSLKSSFGCLHNQTGKPDSLE